MANVVKLKRGSGSDPQASDLVLGELAIRTDNGKLFTKKDDNSVAEISGGGIDDGDKGDITVSNSGATFTIDNDVITQSKIADDAIGTDQIAVNSITTNRLADDAVTYAKIQNVSATNRILGRDSSGAGVIEEITPTNLRTMINVEDGATADQSASEIKTAYESNSDTNAFTDALLSKLNGIAASATNVTNNNQLTNGAGYITATLTNEQVQDIVGGMVSGNTETGITVTYQDGDGTLDFVVASQTDQNFTDTLKNKLDGIESGATADQTAAEIRTLVGNASDSNVFTDALLSKLNGIAASATNVTNNNQLTNGAGYITATLTNEQVQDIVGAMVSGNTESGITVTYQDGDGTLDFSVASQTDNNFTTTLKNKLDGIASGATNVTNTNQLTNGAGFLTSVVTSNIADDNVTGAKIAHNTVAEINLQTNAVTTTKINNGAVTNAKIDSMAASKLTGALPAIDGSSLTGLSAGATGGGSDEIFWCNGQNVTSNFTIPNGKNAMSAGPITINSGVTVTVGSGETWTVV